MAQRGFKRTRHGVEARFDAAEAAVLHQLSADLLGLIDNDDPVPVDPLEALVGMTLTDVPRPTDPVLVRLFPDGYLDDDAAAKDFRRYTEQELRSSKRSALRRIAADVPSSGGKVVLDTGSAEAWLGAFNDLRLALGTRLDVGEDFEDELAGLAPDDARRPALAVYEWLGFLEETLVRALAGW